MLISLGDLYKAFLTRVTYINKQKGQKQSQYQKSYSSVAWNEIANTKSMIIGKKTKNEKSKWK